MSKKFTNNGKVIASANGKMQFNTANADFRSAMQFRYSAECSLADAKVDANLRIAEINRAIKVLEGSTHFNSADVDALNADIAAIRDALSEVIKEYNEKAPKINDAEHNLFYAYRDYIAGTESDANTFERAFMEWADFNGLVPTHDTFAFITRKIGARKASARTILKSEGETLTTALTEKSFLNIFYAVIMEILKKQNLLTAYTFKTKLPERKSGKRVSVSD